MGLRDQEELLALGVVDFFEVGGPVVELVFFDDVAGDFHFGELLVFAVLVFLAHFEHPDCAQLFVLDHVGLLCFRLLVAHFGLLAI